MKTESLSTLLKTQSINEARIIQAKLESFGIPVYLKYEAIGQILGLTTNGLGEVRIEVRNCDLQRAKKLLPTEK